MRVNSAIINIFLKRKRPKLIAVVRPLAESQDVFVSNHQNLFNFNWGLLTHSSCLFHCSYRKYSSLSFHDVTLLGFLLHLWLSLLHFLLRCSSHRQANLNGKVPMDWSRAFLSPPYIDFSWMSLVRPEIPDENQTSFWPSI